MQLKRRKRFITLAVALAVLGAGLTATAINAKPTKHSAEAVDRRMDQVATAADVEELVGHLRGLVTVLRTIGQPLDYTWLRSDIERWHDPQAQADIRARWGSGYFRWSSAETA